MLNAIAWALACFSVVAADIAPERGSVFCSRCRVGADGLSDRQSRYPMVPSRRSDGVVFDGAAVVALSVAALVYGAPARRAPVRWEQARHGSASSALS